MSAGDTLAIEKCLVLPPLGIRRPNGHYLPAYSSGGHLDSNSNHTHTSHVTVKRAPPPKPHINKISNTSNSPFYQPPSTKFNHTRPFIEEASKKVILGGGSTMLQGTWISILSKIQGTIVEYKQSIVLFLKKHKYTVYVLKTSL